MKQKQYSTEEIIRILGQAEEDQTVDAVCRKHKISGFIGAGFRRGCDAVSELWWPASSGGGAAHSGLDTPLFEQCWFSGRTCGDGSDSSAATA